MSDEPGLLFAQICVRLDETPARSLLDLSREFQVSCRTIQNVVASMTGGVNFCTFKDDILIARLTWLLVTHPSSTTKELSMVLGFKSDRTFARAIHRACGVTPAEFRNRIAGKAARQSTPRLKASATVN